MMAMMSFPRMFLDLLFLARAIEGEGCLTMTQPQECATWLVHSVLNRSEKAWWPSSVQEEVQKYYHGYVKVDTPSEEALSAAIVALSQSERVHGLCFMVSERDYHDNPSWNRNLIRKTFTSVSGATSLHFLSDWPGDK
jgi:hypothetical protein